MEEQLEDEDDEDVYILSKVGDVVHALFSTHREAFLPAFERLLPHFTRLLQPGRPWSDLQWGLCIFDDLLEYTGNNCLNTRARYLPYLYTTTVPCVFTKIKRK